MKPSHLDAVVSQLREGGEDIDVESLLRPARPAPAAALPLTVTVPLPAEGERTWLTPADAEVQHSQVWVVKTRGGEILLGQLDGYDTERGHQYWRAINLATRRTVQVRHVLKGSCPRLGGRRERARR